MSNNNKNKYKQIIRYFLLLSVIWFNNSNAVLIFNGCPTYCSCSFLQNVQEIKCSQAQATTIFSLPDVSINPILTSTLGITLTYSYVQRIPSNLCQLAQSLKIIDMSNNLIDQAIDSTTFNCLYNLEFLVLKNNSISSIAENTFDNLRNLRYLDLSRNKIRTIPVNAFANKLPRLSTLIMSYNLLTNLDFWFLYMTSLNYLDLSNNQISSFTNQIKWNPYVVSLNSGFSQILANAELFDLSFNSISKLDDDVLLLYSICNIYEFTYFVRLLNKMQLTGNPIDCSCIKSYNLLTFYQAYALNSAPSAISYRVFSSTCQTPASFRTFSAFTFTNPNTCSSLSKPFPTQYCGNTSTVITTTTPATVLNNNILNTPQLLLNGDPDQVTGSDYFNYKLTDSQIAGIVIGFFGALLLFLILFYCMCPIEVLAVIFGCVPYFYKICPCKSGVKRDKEYDLFISYNKVSENWLKHNLIPFIKENYFIDNYILHYNEANRENEIFGPYIKDIMSKSSCILFILSDQFLMKEWNNRYLREHLRYLITKEKTRFITIQMHDVSDEEVEEYFRQKLQLPQFVSLENDEFLFWTKLGYFLYTNDKDQYEKVMPIQKYKQPKKSSNNPKYIRHDSIDSNESEIPGYNFYKLPILTYDETQDRKISRSTSKVRSSEKSPKRNGFLLDEVNDGYISSKSKKTKKLLPDADYIPEREETKKKHKKEKSQKPDKEIPVLKVHVDKKNETKNRESSTGNLRIHVDTINQSGKYKNSNKQLLKVDVNKPRDTSRSGRRSSSESRSLSRTRSASKSNSNRENIFTEESNESISPYNRNY
jgi:Leucine-rich repeat (LRR) protein